MRKAAVLILAVGLAVPAFVAIAAEEKKDAAASQGQPKKGDPGTNFPMEPLLAPLTDADGKLSGYAYISTRLTAASEAIALQVREKLPFIQDAMVRDINGAAITVAGDLEKVDIAATERRLLADASKVMGAGKVKQIAICTVNIAPLHPVQTPARDVPPEQMIPAGTVPKNPVKSRCD